MAASNLTPERLRELLDYDPDTGIFTWRVRRAGNVLPGMIAGGMNQRGYIQIRVDRTRYKAHRLAWLYVFGHWPAHDIDHRNKNKGDNRIDNLRDATKFMNLQNQTSAQKPNKTGLLGVRLRLDNGRFSAQIRVHGKPLHLGLFDTAEEAYAAYVSAKRKLHDGCTI